MKRSTSIAAATAAALLLAACGGDGTATSDPASDTAEDAADDSSEEAPDDGSDDASDDDGAQDPVTISLASWSLDSTPEFGLLADGFNEAYPEYTVELREYDAAEYDTQMITDLAAGNAPDLYILKNLQHFYTYLDGDQLTDVSDVASELGGDVAGLDFYEVDGVHWAVPYRQDSWYLYYNADLFEAAGVELPDGSWTWDDHADAAVAITDALSADDVKGAYQHSWQSIVQGFANAQAPGADVLSGEYGYLEPYYQRALDLQDQGAQHDFGTVTTNQLTYQGQFGNQEAAMLMMGSWYVATLIAQQESGEAQDFTWGLAPAPQYDSSTVDIPVTFGDPTGIGLNPAIDGSKLEAAEAFLAYAAGEETAIALASIGIKPAYVSDAVTDAYFAVEGVPTDELSQFSFSVNDTKPENLVSPYTPGIATVLGDLHSEVMSVSEDVASAIAAAEARIESEVFN
jgi:multiple sugar transport system substrate-binding protein